MNWLSYILGLTTLPTLVVLVIGSLVLARVASITVRQYLYAMRGIQLADSVCWRREKYVAEYLFLQTPSAISRGEVAWFSVKAAFKKF